MNFKYKCYLQFLLSAFPAGERINYLFQRHITKQLPVSDGKFLRQVTRAFKHYENFEAFNELEVNSKKYYEFGTGWDLIIPLSIYHLGFEVFTIDQKKLKMNELIRDTIGKFNRHHSALPLAIKEKAEIRNSTDLQKKGSKLHYLAPVDARNTGFMKNYFDFASSTSTLEHIPKEDLVKILEESYRILKKGGILSVRIDYKDHWSYFDKKITIYNYLKYSEKKWRKYNPPLHFQNRLRHSDYLQIISDIGFKVVKEETILPTKEEKEILRKLDLATMYRRYDPDDLGIKESVITLLK